MCKPLHKNIKAKTQKTIKQEPQPDMLESPCSSEDQHWQKVQPQTELNQFKTGAAVDQTVRGELNTKRRSYMYNTASG